MPDKYDSCCCLTFFFNNNMNCESLVNEWTDHFYQIINDMTRFSQSSAFISENCTQIIYGILLTCFIHDHAFAHKHMHTHTR